MERDGRSEVKVRHRQAILDAAVALLRDGDGSRFSADELAERAGVSRRTIFNHFPSLDDVLLGVCTETLRVATEQLRSEAPAPRADEATREAMFATAAQALRRADLGGPIIRVWQALGGIGADSQRTQAFAQQALAVVAEELSAQLRTLYPGADPLDVALLASLLTHGVGVIAGHWIESTPAGQPPDATEWDGLLERLLGIVGEGYLPRGSSDPGPAPQATKGEHEHG